MRRRVAWLIAVVCLAVLAGCETYTAITEAPEEFWLTGEAIVTGLVRDILSLIDWLL